MSCRIVAAAAAKGHRAATTASQQPARSMSMRGMVVQATNIQLASLQQAMAAAQPLTMNPVVFPVASSSSKAVSKGRPATAPSKTKGKNRLSSSLPSYSPSLSASSSSQQPDDSDANDAIDHIDMTKFGLTWSQLEQLASKAPTPLRLADMYKYGTGANMEQRLRNAQFLYTELAIRLAQRAYDLLSLPMGLSQESTPIRHVAEVYLQYLQQLREFPKPQTFEQEQAFTEFLQGMVLDRTSIPTAIAHGLVAWQDDRREDLELERQQEMEDALYRFFTARVGLRFLTEHHILSSPTNAAAASEQLRQSQSPISSSSDPQQQQKEEDLQPDRGCIDAKCDPVWECTKVAKEVKRQTRDCYGLCPDIEIVAYENDGAQDFTYVPHHLHYMLAELLKNSCRATVERYVEQGGLGNNLDVELETIRVVIVRGPHEVTIKVADKGGGIPRSKMARIFKFTHSTAKEEQEQDTEFGTVEAGISRMRGFGLPLARIYARYFGGDLTLKSMEGYGLDAYLYLPRLGDACENLPKRVMHSPGELTSLPVNKGSSVNNTGGATRTFSTLLPRNLASETAAQIQRHRMRHKTEEPWVGDHDEVLRDSGDYEEARIRRLLQIIRSRSL